MCLLARLAPLSPAMPRPALLTLVTTSTDGLRCCGQTGQFIPGFKSWQTG